MASLTEIARRVYHDIVVRRSTVRIQPAFDNLALGEPPIFLIGVYRSGTTLLRYVLDSHSRICCPPESDFLGGFSSLVHYPQYKLGFERMGYNEEHVVSKLRELALYFYGNYANSHNKPRWADKSPGYVDYLDFLFKLFPESQFIMIYRNGLDQAHSYTRGGTFMRSPLKAYVANNEDDIRIAAVRYWESQVNKMIAFEEKYPDRCFRIRYEDMCAQPENELRPLFHFLGESWEPQVLRYYEYPHDKGSEDGRVAATTGFSISKDHYQSWPQDLLDRCSHIASRTLQALDYHV